MKTMCWSAVLLVVCARLAQGNLLVNPGFESTLDADNWGTAWGTFSREPWNHPPEGAYAGYIKGGWGGGDNGGVIQSVPAIPGVKYRLSGRFYCDNGWTAASKALKIEFFDEGGHLLDSRVSDLSRLKDGNWIEEGIAATAPAGTVRLQVVVEASGIGPDGTLGVDNLCVEQIP